MARYEKFSKPAHAAYVGRGQRRPNMMDRYVAMIQQQREEDDARFRSEEELKHELFDFTHVTDVDEYGFPKTTRYQVPDHVSDVYVPSKESQTQNSAKAQSSVTNSEPGAE